jgi:hypothetical protein
VQSLLSDGSKRDHHDGMPVTAHIFETGHKQFGPNSDLQSSRLRLEIPFLPILQFGPQSHRASQEFDRDSADKRKVSWKFRPNEQWQQELCHSENDLALDIHLTLVVPFH